MRWATNACGSFYILGGGKANPLGTFAEYVVVERDQVIPTPDHLDDVHAAAWPIGAVTAWRYASSWGYLAPIIYAWHLGL